MKTWLLPCITIFVTFTTPSFVMAEDATFEITGSLDNYLSPSNIDNNPFMHDLLMSEIKLHPGGPVDKEFTEIKHLNDYLIHDIQGRPEKWILKSGESNSFNKFSDVANKAKKQHSLNGNFIWTHTFTLTNKYFQTDLSLLIKNKSFFRKQLQNLFFAQYYKGSSWAPSKDSKIRWALQFPVVINNTVYSANLVGIPRVIGNLRDSSNFLKTTIRISNIKNEHKNSRHIKLLVNPFLFYKKALLGEASDLSLIEKNKFPDTCHHHDPKEIPSVSTFHTFIKADQKFLDCSKKYKNAFKTLKMTPLKSGRINEKSYPEFNELFKASKPTVDLLILSSKGDGWGYSNYLMLIDKYTRRTSNTRIHGSGKTKKGLFKILFQSSGDEEKVSHPDFKPRGQKYSVLERKSKDANQSFRIHLVYMDGYDFSLLGEMSPKMDFVVYQGHSGYGSNLSAFSNSPLLPKKYQTLFVLACSSFDYVLPNFMFAKSFADFESKAIYWDFIGSEAGASLPLSGNVLKKFINFYISAWNRYHKGKNLKRFNYKALLDGLNKADKYGKNQYGSGWKASGISNNQWQPDVKEKTLNEILRTTERTDSILSAFDFILSTSNKETVDKFLSYLVDEKRLPRSSLEDAKNKFMSSRHNSEESKQLLREMLP